MSNLPSIKDAVTFRQEQYGWNQKEMARALGITSSHYCDFLKGRRGLPFVAIRNAYKIGVPERVLLQ